MPKKVRDIPIAPKAKPAPMALTPRKPEDPIEPVSTVSAAPAPPPEPTLLDRLRARWPEAELEDLAAGKMRLVRMSF